LIIHPPFPFDFVVLDVDEDSKVRFVFGGPFITTGKALMSNKISSCFELMKKM
jgi:hypothetical protein